MMNMIWIFNNGKWQSDKWQKEKPHMSVYYPCDPLPSCPSVWQRKGCKEGDFPSEPLLICSYSLHLKCLRRHLLLLRMLLHVCCAAFIVAEPFLWRRFICFSRFPVCSLQSSPLSRLCCVVKCLTPVRRSSAEAGSPSTSASWREDPRTTGLSWPLSLCPGTKMRRWEEFLFQCCLLLNKDELIQDHRDA